MCSAPLFDQDIARDVLGRARSVQTFWGNPEAGPLAARPPPWRGYAYDAEGRLTTVFEQPGLIEPVVPSFAPHSITNADVETFVTQNSPASEPILRVDWVREAEVGGVLDIVERTTPQVSRWHHDGPRDPGHELGTIELDNATYLIAHDQVGRVTQGAGAAFVYDQRGRLLHADRDGLHETYLYDAAGRLSQIINGKTRTIINDGDQLIAAMNLDDGTRWEVVPGAGVDQILEFESFELGKEGRFVAVTDHRNSVVGWWSADNRQMEHILEYTPHGRVRLLAPHGSEVCKEEGTGVDCVATFGLPPFGFAGAYRSDRTGVTYMRNRWYAPKLGQFLTHDPLGYLDAYNLYSYAGMDPINFWDPYGLASESTALTDRQEAILGSELAKPDAFGNNPECPGCFDPPSKQPDRQLVREILTRPFIEIVTPETLRRVDILVEMFGPQYLPSELGNLSGESEAPEGDQSSDDEQIVAESPEVSGRVATRINLATGPTRFTPLRESGHPVSAGWGHVVEGHFNRPVSNNRSVFSASESELRSILQSPQVVKSPVTDIGNGQFLRTVDVARTIGTSSLNRGGGATSVLKVFTDEAGNLITTFPW